MGRGGLNMIIFIYKRSYCDQRTMIGYNGVSSKQNEENNDDIYNSYFEFSNVVLVILVFITNYDLELYIDMFIYNSKRLKTRLPS